MSLKRLLAVLVLAVGVTATIFCGVSALLQTTDSELTAPTHPPGKGTVKALAAASHFPVSGLIVKVAPTANV